MDNFEAFTKQVVNLTLNVNDIIALPPDANRLATYDASFITDVGTITNWGCKVTWNINFKELLGDLYDKHDMFNIELVQFLTLPSSNGGTLRPLTNGNFPQNNCINLYMSGLRFTSSSYSIPSRNETGVAFVTTLANNATNTLNEDPNQSASGIDIWYGVDSLYSVSKGWGNNNLTFRKQARGEITLMVGATASNLTIVAQNTLFSSQQMPRYAARFNITPFQ